eukprot:2819526-Amphidinium_carterae.1
MLQRDSTHVRISATAATPLIPLHSVGSTQLPSYDHHPYVETYGRASGKICSCNNIGKSHVLNTSQINVENHNEDSNI